MSLPTVKEGCSAWLQVTLLDKLGELAVPTSVRYRIDCLTVATQIKDWTAATAASTQEIFLSANDHVIIGPKNKQETLRVTVEATYASSADRITSEFDYVLTALSAI